MVLVLGVVAWCIGVGLNHRPLPYQGSALTTELPKHGEASCSARLAAPQGLEPQPPEPESGVLPLDDGALVELPGSAPGSTLQLPAVLRAKPDT